MPHEHPCVLVADDQPAVLEALRLLLSDAGFDADLVTSVHRVKERLDSRTYDLLLMDLNYDRDTTSGQEGLDLLTDVHARAAGLPVVVMTGWGNVDMAVEAMRRGARSFVQKPWDNRALVDIVKREVVNSRTSRAADDRARHEWEEAAIIQRALLPSTLPSIRHCSFAARWQPAAGIGGDCYDVLRFTDTRAGVAIADVIGKGLPAALLMASLQTSLRAFAAEYTTAAEVTTRVNRLLCRGIASGKFVTFCYVVVDTQRGRLAFCNAGHNAPVLVRQDGQVERLSSTGLVLGVQNDGVYHEGELPVSPGDRLVMFTDGISEADRDDGEQFGEEALVEVAVRNRSESAPGMVAAIVDGARDFAGSFRDDATVIVAAMS